MSRWLNKMYISRAGKNVQNAAFTLGSKSIWSRSWIYLPTYISKRIFLNFRLLTTTPCCISIRSSAFLWCKMLWKCFGDREWGREESHSTPTSISLFDFYGIKTLWFEFGNDIFTGRKMPTLSSWRSSISLHKVAEKRAFQL